MVSSNASALGTAALLQTCNIGYLVVLQDGVTVGNSTYPGGGGKACLTSLLALLGLFPPQDAPMPAPGFCVLPACLKFLISRRSSLISLIRATFSCSIACRLWQHNQLVVNCVVSERGVSD